MHPAHWYVPSESLKTAPEVRRRTLKGRVVPWSKWQPTSSLISEIATVCCFAKTNTLKNLFKTVPRGLGEGIPNLSNHANYFLVQKPGQIGFV